MNKKSLHGYALTENKEGHRNITELDHEGCPLFRWEQVCQKTPLVCLLNDAWFSSMNEEHQCSEMDEGRIDLYFSEPVLAFVDRDGIQIFPKMMERIAAQC